MDHILDEGVFKYAEFGYGERSVFKMDSIRMDKRISFELLTDDRQILLNFYNSCIAQIGYMGNQTTIINRMKTKAANLLALIRKEYHLE
jgi:hypothetical protein